MQALQRFVANDAILPLQQEAGNLPSAPDTTEAVDALAAGSGLNRVLVVEDDPTLLAFYIRVLQQKNMPVDQSPDGHDALEKLSITSYDLVITDLTLPGLDGISLLQWIQLNRPTTRAVVITGDERPETILAAMRAGARDYLVKPISLDQFLKLINRCNQPQRSANHQIFSSLMNQVMHDVSGKIFGLEGMIKRLKRGRLGMMGTEVGNELETMQVKIDQLKGLTTDYCELAWNLLEGGVIPTERIELKGEVISQVLGEMQPALARKEIRVACNQDLSADSDAMVIGNRVMLKSLFRTLFTNAIRHCTPAGTLSYGVTSNGRRYKIHVANEGEVVPVHQQASIFEEFVQISPGKSSPCQEQGAGLGLAIAKDIVRQHGGDIWYESSTNGSKFVCTLPSCQKSLSAPISPP